MTALGTIRRIAKALGCASDNRKDEPEVIAITNCYPTRLILYTAAFQGGWKVQFLPSLRAALEGLGSRHPRAVLYDNTCGDSAWQGYCSAFSQCGIPFVLVDHKSNDETFLVALSAGAYPAWGAPLTSEGVVKAVEIAEEIIGLSDPQLAAASSVGFGSSPSASSGNL
jgi:hypothetical protein